MFIITKKFISGFLRGMTVREKTSVKFKEGHIYKEALTSGKYIVVKVDRS